MPPRPSALKRPTQHATIFPDPPDVRAAWALERRSSMIDHATSSRRRSGQMGIWVPIDTPGVLGRLRTQLNPGTWSVVRGELAKDLVKFAVTDLDKHLPN